jgi:Helix-turn-helix domain
MSLTIDDYVIDTLMRDLTEHERRPSAFLVYLYVWRMTLGKEQRRVNLSYQELSEATGLSKSAVQNAVRLLKGRALLASRSESKTATPSYRVERPWNRRKALREK